MGAMGAVRGELPAEVFFVEAFVAGVALRVAQAEDA